MTWGLLSSFQSLMFLLRRGQVWVSRQDDIHPILCLIQCVFCRLDSVCPTLEKKSKRILNSDSLLHPSLWAGLQQAKAVISHPIQRFYEHVTHVSFRASLAELNSVLLNDSAIFLCITVKLLWNNKYCIKRYINEGDSTITRTLKWTLATTAILT